MECRHLSFPYMIWCFCLRSSQQCSGVHCPWLWNLNEQWATRGVSFGTSPNKELQKSHWKSRVASISPRIFLEEIRAYDELQIVVTEVGQVTKMVTVPISKFSEEGLVTRNNVRGLSIMFQEAVYLPECLDEFQNISQVLNVQKNPSIAISSIRSIWFSASETLVNPHTLLFVTPSSIFLFFIQHQCYCCCLLQN